MRNIWIKLLAVGILLQACSSPSDTDEDTGGVDEDGVLWVENQNTTVDSTAYFVSVNGSDTQTGTEAGTAFRTLAHALEKVHPGGTINVLPGTYEEGIGLLYCGDGAAGITIRGLNGIPIFDGKNSAPLGVFCESCSHLKFVDLKFINYTDIGIGSTESDHLTFENLMIEHNGHAVQLKEWELEGYGIHVDFSSDIIIENCDVSENGPRPQVSPDYIMGTGINTFGNTDVQIIGNKSYRNTGGGILVEDSQNVLVENNEIYENDLDATVDEWWDGGIWLDGGSDVLLKDNLIYDNLGPGIQISDEDRQNPTNYELRNNVCRDNYYGIYIWNFGTTDWPDSGIIARSGNQFTGNSRQDVWIEAWID